MFAIAANVCRERRRSAWRRSRIEVVSDDGLVGDRAAPEHSHEELTGVADALAELTPNQRRAILMREWQGLSYREIATELSLSEGAVETLHLPGPPLARAQARPLARARVWGISNLGSALAWGKAALGGGAAQVAAATLVVTAGVTAASPFVPLHGSQRPGAVANRPRRRSLRPRPLQFARSLTRRDAVSRPRPKASPPVTGHTRPFRRKRTIRFARRPDRPASRRRWQSNSPCHPQLRPSPSRRLRRSRKLPKVEVAAGLPPLPKVEVPPVPPLPPVSVPTCRFRLCRSCRSRLEARAAARARRRSTSARRARRSAPCRGRPSSRRPGRGRRASA